MLVKQYEDMLSAKSVIRTLAEFASTRGKEIGYENVFDYSLGNPSVPVPSAFNETCIRLLKESDPLTLHGYSQSLGIPEVREKVALSLKNKYSLPYTRDHIFMTSAAASAIAHSIRLIAQQGDEIITFAPFFPEYMPYVTLAGVELKVIPPQTEDFQMNIEALEEAITKKTKAVLINTPNNPSGVMYSEESLGALAEVLERKSKELGHRIYLISDEPYREIVFDGRKYPYPACFYTHTISCYSFSKSLSLPGERIGYIAVHPAMEEGEKMIQMCGQISRGIGHNCPSSLIQLAVAEHLYDQADMSIYEKNRDILYKELTELGFTCVKPEGTFYIFPKALEEDAVSFCNKALKYDLILVPADSFGCPGYFRMAYCIETKKAERSLASLRKFAETEYPDRKRK